MHLNASRVALRESIERRRREEIGRRIVEDCRARPQTEAEGRRRPVLVVTRSEAVPVLTWLVVAPVTRSVRDIPTHLDPGTDEGLDVPCAAAPDNLPPIRRSIPTERAGALAPARRIELCRALRAVAGCRSMRGLRHRR